MSSARLVTRQSQDVEQMSASNSNMSSLPHVNQFVDWAVGAHIERTSACVFVCAVVQHQESKESYPTRQV